jgi:hypothetical protein
MTFTTWMVGEYTGLNVAPSTPMAKAAKKLNQEDNPVVFLALKMLGGLARYDGSMHSGGDQTTKVRRNRGSTIIDVHGAISAALNHGKSGALR